MAEKTYTFTCAVSIDEIVEAFIDNLADGRDDYLTHNAKVDLDAIMDCTIDRDGAYIAEGYVEFPVTVVVRT